MTLAGSGLVAILAGSDQLPILLSDSLRRKGRDHRILAFRGFAAPATRDRADALVDLVDVRRMKHLLEQWRPGVVTFAGAVRRPRASEVFNALSAFQNRHELAALYARGDDGLLRSAIGLCEAYGYPVVGVHELAPELLAAKGVSPGRRPGQRRAKPARRALQRSRRSRLMTWAKPAWSRGRESSLSKVLRGPTACSPASGASGDLGAKSGPIRAGCSSRPPSSIRTFGSIFPAIGPRTMTNAHRAGLKGVAIGCGVTLVLDQDETIATADRLGLFLVALEPGRGGDRA